VEISQPGGSGSLGLRHGYAGCREDQEERELGSDLPPFARPSRRRLGHERVKREVYLVSCSWSSRMKVVRLEESPWIENCFDRIRLCFETYHRHRPWRYPLPPGWLISTDDDDDMFQSTTGSYQSSSQSTEIPPRHGYAGCREDQEQLTR
jgi:hypothetical protein